MPKRKLDTPEEIPRKRLKKEIKRMMKTQTDIKRKKVRRRLESLLNLPKKALDARKAEINAIIGKVLTKLSKDTVTESTTAEEIEKSPEAIESTTAEASENTTAEASENTTAETTSTAQCKDWLEINPKGITRLFVGNLSYKVTEKSLKDHLQECTHVLFLKDKESGEFYGSGFVEMKTAEDAARVSQLDGSLFLGRRMKVKFAPPRPGQKWPPENKYAVRPYPGQGCRKIFVANVAFEAEDEDFTQFFADCGEIEEMRWLSDRDTGEFKGCGFIVFQSEDGCKKAAELSGVRLKGRQIRIDWAE